MNRGIQQQVAGQPLAEVELLIDKPGAGQDDQKNSQGRPAQAERQHQLESDGHEPQPAQLPQRNQSTRQYALRVNLQVTGVIFVLVNHAQVEEHEQERQAAGHEPPR